MWIRNGRERERDGDGGETSVRYQKWKRERERWRRERRHEEEATHGRWTVVPGTLTGIHSGDLPDIPCREVSFELIRFLKH